MRVNVQVPQRAFATLAEDMKAALAKPVTDLMKRETRTLERAAEQATSAAGLGKLAKTWNSKVYPEGKDVLGPAGVIWSKAPLPMRAFTEGVTIRGADGGWLAIPTPQVARMRGVSREGGARRQRITPGGFERATGMKLRFVFTGRSSAFLFASGVRHRNAARGMRARTAAETRRGRSQEEFLAFVLVRQVSLRKRVDLQALLRAAQGRILAGLSDAVARAAAEFQRASNDNRAASRAA